MVSHLSTFSSKVAHNAAFWTVLLIVGIEFFGGRKLADTVDVHQVDRLCERIERDRFDAPVVVLGDSVAEGAFREREADATRFAILPSNQAIEATGAETVYVTHGYTEVFSRYLKEKGYDARVVKAKH